MKLLGCRILVEQYDGFEQTDSGLYIPLQSQQKQAKGRVVEVGTGTIYDKEQVFNVGDEVIFYKGKGMSVPMGDKEYLLLEDRDIFIIV